jgi:hypothetical protein
MVAVPIGSKVLIEGLGRGVVIGHRPGRPGWSSEMYDWVQMSRFGDRLHLFSHLEVVTGRLSQSSAGSN